MQCPRCQHPSQEGARFCASCGASLGSGCLSCGATLPPESRFCAACGTAAGPRAGRAEPSTRISGERRQLTVMFCDLAGSTALAQRLDPEELSELFGSYQRICVRAVDEFGGHVAQYLGDGVLVYFGYPRALEDAAERALRAALGIREGLEELNEQRRGKGEEPILVRIGIHTGQVVVTEVGAAEKQETLALGDTTNVAARLQSLAEPGAICVSQATLRLVPGLLRTRDLGTPALKGVTEPIQVHEVEGLLGAPRRFRGGGAPARLSGRDSEIAQLLDCWGRAVEGRGQVVLVSGEPGIGKSRLVAGLGERIGDQAHLALELACSPFEHGSAFHPAIDLLERGLGFFEDDTPEQKLLKLATRLSAIAGLDAARAIPYLGRLLGLPESPLFPLEHTGPELQRELTLQALVAPVLALAESLPLLVVCEDLHWSDPSTLEWLERLVDEAASRRVLLVLTFRPDFEPAWPSRSWQSRIALQRLSHASTLELVRRAALSAKGLSDEVIQQLAERADGVPLFAEELAHAVVESAAPGRERGRADEPLTIPSTLQDSLMARLDRLGSGRSVAQLAAALGRSFGYALIEAVAELPQAPLVESLAQLVDAEILFQTGAPPRSNYTFKHALLQDTAYGSLLRSRRRELHARIAGVLRERFPQRAAAEPDLIGHHCAAGGLTSEAVDAYRLAGEQAMAQAAYHEAGGHCARALVLLATLPEDAARHAKEIEVRLSQLGPLVAQKGYDAAEVLSSVQRTDALLEAIGTGPQQIPGLLRLMTLHTNRMDRAREYAKALLDVVEPLGIAPLCMAGYIVRGTSATVCGTVPEACADLKRALEIAETIDLPKPKMAFDIDAVAMGAATYSLSLVLAGKPETALRYVERATERARALVHPRTTASALAICSMGCQFAGDVERVAALTGEANAAMEGRGFHTTEVVGHVMGSWADVMRGDATGLDRLDEALQSGEAHGVIAGMPNYYLTAADANLFAGRPVAALERVELAEAFMERSGEQMAHEPQALTLRGRILLESGGDLDEAEAFLLRGFALWERNQSPWMLLNAATLLGRLALERAKGAEEARVRLARVYTAFDEGFETARLRDARRIMEQLG